MSNLTTFSKVLITLTVMGCMTMFVIMCYNCTNSEHTNYNQPHYSQSAPVQDYGNHQVITQPGGTQVVVVRDQSGSEFFMDYLMFTTMMNMAGGMNNVYNYRDQHRYDRDWDERQTQYRSTSKTVVNNYYGSSVDDTKSFTEQVTTKEKERVQYEKSNGFSKPTQPTVQPSSGTQSGGFSETFHSPNIPTTTPEPSYQKSPGFKSTSTPSTYTPSSGFGSSGSTSTGGSSYKPSGGFKSTSTPSKSNPGSSYKSSSGFGKKKN